MPRIVVLGGGICGLATAMMLARDGNDVTVLERDPAPAPDSLDEAWASWQRRGVAQFRQPHYIVSRARHVLDGELPDVRDALVADGACSFDPLTTLPSSIPDRAARAGDERFATLTARRPPFERAFARAAETEPGVEVRRGVSVEGVLAGPSATDGTLHVAGVRTSDGEEVHADLVVDAMGRGSKLPAWLADAGAAPVHEEAADSGFVYYTRFFRGTLPEFRAPLSTPIGSISILTLPGDRDTWSVTLYASTGDQPVKALRHSDRWGAVMASLPLHAHWVDGEPVGDVVAMSGIADRYRRLATDGRPVATGVALVADAAACTNPSLGRGISLGLMHASALPATVRTHLDDPRAFSEAWDTSTEERLTPWYRATVAFDRGRRAQVEAIREGRPAPTPDTPAAKATAALVVAMRHDPDVFRGFLDIMGCMALPQEVMARPGFAERVSELGAAHDAPPPPGPSREQLLALLA
jgi:2-polyprenyl-6-methoxyphenol hydroxylase-like FAD-dependent oxidoreductase